MYRIFCRKSRISFRCLSAQVERSLSSQSRNSRTSRSLCHRRSTLSALVSPLITSASLVRWHGLNAAAVVNRYLIESLIKALENHGSRNKPFCACVNAYMHTYSHARARVIISLYSIAVYADYSAMISLRFFHRISYPFSLIPSLVPFLSRFLLFPAPAFHHLKESTYAATRPLCQPPC